MERRSRNIRKIRCDGVSVVVPTFERPDCLDRLLLSIEKQSKPVNEVIIVDDHSVNKEAYHNIINRYSKKINIKYIRLKKNSGAPFCRNIGIEQSKYKFIALTDDDDEWKESKNEKEYKLISNNNLGLVYTHGIAVNDDGKELYRFRGTGRENDLKSLLKECFIPSSSVMVSYEAIRKAGFFDIKMLSCQDWDMWVRILSHNYKYDYIAEPLIIYHKHQGISIGMSPNAVYGYKRFYRKHICKYIRNFIFTKEFRLCLHAIKIATLGYN